MAEKQSTAAPIDSESSAQGDVRVCLVRIGEDFYAIPVGMLTEIIIPQKLFPVPTTPPHVLGVINLRGNIVPIVDIRVTLSLPQVSVPGQIAILKIGPTTIGIAVDHVSEVVAVPRKNIMALPQETAAQPGKNRSRFFQAVVRRETGTAALLNVERILDEIKLS